MSRRAASITRTGKAKKQRLVDPYVDDECVAAEEREGMQAPYQAPHPYCPSDVWSIVFLFLTLAERMRAACVSRQWRGVASQGPAHGNNSLPFLLDADMLRFVTSSPIMQRHVSGFKMRSFIRLAANPYDCLPLLVNLHTIEFRFETFYPWIPELLTRVRLTQLTTLVFAYRPGINTTYFRNVFAVGCTFPALERMGHIELDEPFLVDLARHVPQLKDLSAHIVDRCVLQRLHMFSTPLESMTIALEDALSERRQTEAPLQRSDLASLRLDRLTHVTFVDYGIGDTMAAWIAEAVQLRFVHFIRPNYMPDCSTLAHPSLCSFWVSRSYRADLVWPPSMYPTRTHIPNLDLDDS